MPYIKRDKRIKAIGKPENPGELNFNFSTYINNYIKEKGLNYTTINEVIGVLECCKLELYRRVVAPLEDVKCKTNGDVFNKELIKGGI